MRILTGLYKGKRIVMPEGIRPTQDKVRKALFDIFGSLEGASLLELFAGSGAVGLEALSRGAGQVTLVEQARQCLEAIERNIRALGVRQCAVIRSSAEQALDGLRKEGSRFDIVFLDPPYHKGLSKKTLQMLGACDIVAPNGFIVVQHFKKESLPECAGDFILFKRAVYGDTVLSFYQRTQ